jgi:hypothetical protein
MVVEGLIARTHLAKRRIRRFNTIEVGKQPASVLRLLADAGRIVWDGHRGGVRPNRRQDSEDSRYSTSDAPIGSSLFCSDCRIWTIESAPRTLFEIRFTRSEDPVKRIQDSVPGCGQGLIQFVNRRLDRITLLLEIPLLCFVCEEPPYPYSFPCDRVFISNEVTVWFLQNPTVPPACR